jgi:hypothetical protein
MAIHTLATTPAGLIVWLARKIGTTPVPIPHDRLTTGRVVLSDVQKQRYSTLNRSAVCSAHITKKDFYPIGKTTHSFLQRKL